MRALLLLLALALPLAVAHAGNPTSKLATKVVATGLSFPTHVASPPGDTSRLVVIQQNGVILLIKDDVLLPTPFLDISSLIPQEAFNGLLGIAFHPDYDTNGFFYLHHSTGPDPSDRMTIARYTVSGDPDIADPLSREEILVLPYPGAPGHHLGGWIGFGPDGMLYIPLGDGQTTGFETAGGARSQDLASPWGKTLRIDVDGDDYPGDDDRDFAIPPDNPFVGLGGEEAVWNLGLRQPYRADFDSETGDFWLTDVGWQSREEVEFIPVESPGGENFGWNCSEGTGCFTNLNCSCTLTSITYPYFEYDHSQGCSIIGGALYRGTVLDNFQGRFFFADWCTNRIWSIREQAGSTAGLVEHTAELAPDVGDFTSILSIAKDGAGEIYITDIDTVYKIVKDPWQNLGGGTSGSSGLVIAQGEGPLTAGSLNPVSLQNAPPNALLLVWIALNPGPEFSALAGGTVHAFPFSNQLLFFADAAGQFSAATPWPAGVPSETNIWFQFFVDDPGVIWQITMSNGLLATTP